MAPGAPKARSFADLRARTLAGVAMAALAALALGLGGWIAAGFAAACAGGMGWELRRMVAGRFDGAGWVVVATDVGAYFAGRIIGGPKLWPRVSPSKTWAGLGGGMACATAVGAIFSSATTGTLIHEVAIVSGVMAVVSQGGDLAESSLKRRAGVKDSSNLIPGHGGLLDRMGGLRAAALVAAILTFLRGKSVFIW